MRNLINERFGKLTVLEATEKRSADRSVIFKCLCDCGNITYVPRYSLVTGHAKSCGCLRKVFLKEYNQKHSHGWSRERLHRVWGGMIERCSNPNNNRYPRYGGRGIKVCDEWRKNYAAFREWAYKNGYDETAKRNECTIDRIDNDGPYSPDNCRWVNMSIQCRNKGHKQNE